MSINIGINGFMEKKMDNGRFRMDYRLWNQNRTETYIDAAARKKIIYQRNTEAEDGNFFSNTKGHTRSANPPSKPEGRPNHTVGGPRTFP